ncbi:MAG: thioredoxin domain-containing protein, partial [Candidatus Sumerlaeia bacterium]|nr:thioredoxin domain-containing protein [Candidatus Sumerlaeia bacterium]
AHGGIYDQIGGGFSRYSVDRHWLIPHFEKMLYDQALIVRAAVEAWLVTGKDEFRRTAEETLAYVSRDMAHPDGGFFSAEDADSEGEEGKFYVWTTEEVVKLLGKTEGELYTDIFGFEDEGNFADEATHKRTGVNIPHLSKPLSRRAEDLKIPLADLEQRLEEARTILFKERKKRIHPLKDDKVLTDWNGLMIGAFARAGAAFGVREYTDAARRAAAFILEEVARDGHLLKRWRNGQAGLPAHLEDYAFMAWGLVDLYEATLETRWLAEAAKLVEVLFSEFWDKEAGAFFQVAHSGEELIVRNKEFYDGAIPSGNGAAALVLLRLGRLLGREEWEQQADALFRAASPKISMGPGNFTLLMSALDFALGESSEVILAGDPSTPEFGKMLRVYHRRFRPGSVLLHLPGEKDGGLLKLAPWLGDYKAGGDGSPLAYVCRNHACEKPVASAKELEALLDRNAP